MITHDLDSLYAISDRVAVLADKKIVAMAPVRELEKSDHPWIREYFLGPRGRAACGPRAARRSTLMEENANYALVGLLDPAADRLVVFVVWLARVQFAATTTSTTSSSRARCAA